jgi:hypothetical protein
MAKGYRPVDRDQPFLFPPDMREWLPPDQPVWLVFCEGRRGDEVPGEAWRPRSRNSRIAAALASLKAERLAEEEEEARAEAYRARRQAGERAGCPPASAAVAEAEENLARVRAARAAELAELEERYAAGQPRRSRPAGVDDHCRVRQAPGQGGGGEGPGAPRPSARPPSGRRPARAPARCATSPTRTRG